MPEAPFPDLDPPVLAAPADIARGLNSRCLWLVTSNSNVAALRFYQRRGMRLVRVWTDALTRARQEFKPEIPLIGDHGIPIRDELELELKLDGNRHEDGRQS